MTMYEKPILVPIHIMTNYPTTYMNSRFKLKDFIGPMSITNIDEDKFLNTARLAAWPGSTFIFENSKK